MESVIYYFKKGIFLLFLTVNAVSYCQENGGMGLPSVIPPSPPVGALNKFGNYPIGYNTGTVEISVPLYSIPLDKRLSLDISLDYHSSGIKVNEVGGIAGLGWALSAGGYISREIRGLRDEISEAGFYSYSKKNKGWTVPNQIDELLSPSFLNKVMSHQLDTEPDLFILQFLGRNYKKLFELF